MNRVLVWISGLLSILQVQHNYDAAVGDNLDENCAVIWCCSGVSVLKEIDMGDFHAIDTLNLLVFAVLVGFFAELIKGVVGFAAPTVLVSGLGAITV